jgi:hypothetical protein
LSGTEYTKLLQQPRLVFIPPVATCKDAAASFAVSLDWRPVVVGPLVNSSRRSADGAASQDLSIWSVK